MCIYCLALGKKINAPDFHLITRTSNIEKEYKYKNIEKISKKCAFVAGLIAWKLMLGYPLVSHRTFS